MPMFYGPANKFILMRIIRINEFHKLAQHYIQFAVDSSQIPILPRGIVQLQEYEVQKKHYISLGTEKEGLNSRTCHLYGVFLCVPGPELTHTVLVLSKLKK